MAFDVAVQDEGVPLSTLTAQIVYGDQVVEEISLRTNAYGNYESKIYIPFYKNIQNGTAKIRFILQNTSLTKGTEVVELPLQRPDYPYLTLVTEDGERYRMERTALYHYEAKNVFPMKLSAHIEAPAYGTLGNILTFGYANNLITLGAAEPIPFSYITDGEYVVSFNTKTFDAGPFMSYSINGIDLQLVGEDLYQADVDLAQGETLLTEGIANINDWWIDPDYFNADGEQHLFSALSGRYRITADFSKEYLIIEALNGDQYATLESDGTGAVWIIGEGVGKPDLGNQVGWTTEKALCMAPIGDKKYQISLVAGQQIQSENINFKFFHQKGWGGEFTNATLSTDSDIVFVGDGSNGRDPGNLGIINGTTLESGATYVFTLDLSEGNSAGSLTVAKLP